MASSVAEDARVSGAAKGPLGTGREWKEQGAMSTATTTTSEPTATNKRAKAEDKAIVENTEAMALRIAARKGKVVNPVPKPTDADQAKPKASKPLSKAQVAKNVAEAEQAARDIEVAAKALPAAPRTMLRIGKAIHDATTLEGKTAICKAASELLGKQMLPGAAVTALRAAGKAERVSVAADGAVTSLESGKGNGNGGERAPRATTPQPEGITPEMVAAIAKYRKAKKAGLTAEEMRLANAYVRIRKGGAVEPRAPRQPKAPTAKQPSKADILALIMDTANDAMTVAELRAKLFPVVAQPEGEQTGATTEQAEPTA